MLELDALPSWGWWAIAGADALLVATGVLFAISRLGAQTTGRLPPVLRTASERLGRPSVVVSALVLYLVWGAALLAAPILDAGWRSTATVALVPVDPLETSADTTLLLGPRYLSLLYSPDVL